MPSLLPLLLLFPLLQPALSEVKFGLLVPAVAKNDQIDNVQTFLEGAIDLVKEEPDTIQWYGVKFADFDDPTFAIFDTFVSEDGRQTHLDGKVAAALFDNADKLFEDTPVVNKVDILASKVQESGDGSLTEGLSVGLHVNFTAKSDKVQDVRDFLVSALPLVEDEQDTLFWYAIELDNDVFAIVDFFKEESGREAHLNGKVAEALFSKVDELFTGKPEINKLDVVSANIKRENGDNSEENQNEDNGDQKSMEEMQKMIEEEGAKMAERIKEQQSNQNENENQNEENKDEENQNEENQNEENQNQTENRGGKEQLCQELCKGLVMHLRESGDCKSL